VRPPVEGDIPFVLGLVNEHAPEPSEEDTLRREWGAPGVEVERDARVEDDAYALVERLDETRAWLDVQGRPSRDLLDWAEARAAECATKAFAGAWSTNESLLRSLEQRGFAFARHSHRMLIDLAERTGEPTWPQGVSVRVFEPGDEHVFYDVHQEAFEDSWEPISEACEEWAHWLLSPEAFVPELWFLAHADGEAAGIAICHPHRARPDVGWVRILGVRRPWRRRGLGRALLLHAFAEFRRRGLLRAGLGVDAESPTGANRLYHSVGMHISAEFEIYEKALA
jgi:mycothiol synthase